MSSRKRPLAELSQTQATPSRHGPSTPHAIRALQQQRSGTKLRSSRSVRHIDANSVRLNSARGILRRFAKVTAPVTQKRIKTPGSLIADKENHVPSDGDEDEVELQMPNLTFAIEESLEEEDSELPAAPTPSVLPDDDEDEEQPTVTFQNLQSLRDDRPTNERYSRRRSRLSILPQSEAAAAEEEEIDEGNTTLMTERGRRAVSEEVTGQLSRYSFGSFRMSDFGSELEIRRESDKQGKMVAPVEDDNYGPVIGDDSLDLGEETENLRNLRQSYLPSPTMEESIHAPGFGDETFQLDMPNTIEDEALPARQAIEIQLPEDQLSQNLAGVRNQERLPPAEHDSGRRQTLLETATDKVRQKRRKGLKLTRHGNPIPSLPSSLIKRVAAETQTKAGRRKLILGKDHMKALEQATEWFFEQVGEDLAIYSSHGRRKKRVDADDVLLLMRRQRVVSYAGELQALANDWLPAEVLKSLDLPDKP